MNTKNHRTYPTKRKIPRPFNFPWGKGNIIEEVSYRGTHHEPVIQLLEFENGFKLLRFCSYTLSGQFERNSWIAGKDEMTGLKKKLKEEAPKIREILRAFSN